MHSDDEEESDKQQHPSNLFKTKLFIASKVVETRLGRTVIAHFIGNDGNQLLQVFKEVAELDPKVGKNKAHRLYVSILKFSVKIKLLNDKRLLRKRDFWHMTRTMHQLSLKVHSCLLRDDKIDLSPLVRAFALVRDMISLLLRPHLDAKHLHELCDLFNYFGGEAFLDFLFHSAKLQHYKKAALTHVQVMVVPLLKGRRFNKNMEELCANPKCQRVRLDYTPHKEFPKGLGAVQEPSLTMEPGSDEEIGEGDELIDTEKIIKIGSTDKEKVEMGGETVSLIDPQTATQPVTETKNKQPSGTEHDKKDQTQLEFNTKHIDDDEIQKFMNRSAVASNYCVVHHLEQYIRLRRSPNVLHFVLGDGASYYPFADSAKQVLGHHIRRFYKATVRYQRSTPADRAKMVNSLYEIYISKKAKRPVFEDLPVSVVDDITRRLRTYNEAISQQGEKNNLNPSKSSENVKSSPATDTHSTSLKTTTTTTTAIATTITVSAASPPSYIFSSSSPPSISSKLDPSSAPNSPALPSRSAPEKNSSGAKHSRNVPAPSDLFTRAQETAFKLLDKFFKDNFLHSPLYKEYLEIYKPPAAVTSQFTRIRSHLKPSYMGYPEVHTAKLVLSNSNQQQLTDSIIKILLENPLDGFVLSPFDRLPRHLYGRIFEFSTPEEMKQYRPVNKMWSTICNKNWVRRFAYSMRRPSFSLALEHPSKTINSINASSFGRARSRSRSYSRESNESFESLINDGVEENEETGDPKQK